MKAIVVRAHGGPEALELVDIPVPTPTGAEVLVQNHFVGVNFVDTQHRAGLYFPVVLPLIPGIEGAGVVAAVGTDVSEFQISDRVAYGGYMGGDYAEFTLVPQDRLVAVPQEITLAQAAGGLLQGMAAHVLTQQVYQLQRGDWVLIHAAAGGVGSMLVQFAKHRGATVLGITSSAGKADFVRRVGADHVIVSSTSDFRAETMRLTAGQGVHVVYDGVGGPQFERNLDVLRARGRLVLFGQAGGQPLPLDISRLSGITGSGNKGSLWVTWASASDYYATTEGLRACASAVFEAVLRAHLRLNITGVYALEQVAEAHRLLESRASTGKLLLKLVQVT
jgi:NADPH2:quinone reductase